MDSSLSRVWLLISKVNALGRLSRARRRALKYFKGAEYATVHYLINSKIFNILTISNSRKFFRDFFEIT